MTELGLDLRIPGSVRGPFIKPELSLNSQTQTVYPTTIHQQLKSFFSEKYWYHTESEQIVLWII